MTLGAMWELYKLQGSWLRLTPSSRRIYEQGVSYWGKLANMEADKITRPMVLDFRDDNYDNKARCRLGLMMVNTVMQFGYDHGYCQANPARGISGMPPKTGWKRWTKEELDKVLDKASVPIRNAILLALYTGQRRSDLARMRWDNYDGKYIHIIQQKTRKPLAIPVHPLLKIELERMMKERITECAYILTSVSGWQWAPDYLTATMTKTAKAAGVDKVLHGLRKTTASVLAELGCSPFEIAAITGQSLKEVISYSKEADQKIMAQRAIDRWAMQYA